MREDALDEEVERMVSSMQSVIELGRAGRDRRTKPLKLPLRKVTIMSDNKTILADLDILKSYVVSELNVHELELSSDEAAFVSWSVKADRRALGRRLKKEMKAVVDRLEALSQEEIKQLQTTGTIEVCGHTVSKDEVQLVRGFSGDQSRFEAAFSDEILVVLDLEIDEGMRNTATARAICNRVQKLRKEAQLSAEDQVNVFYEVVRGSRLEKVINEQFTLITESLKSTFKPKEEEPGNVVAQTEATVDDEALHLWLAQLSL